MLFAVAMLLNLLVGLLLITGVLILRKTQGGLGIEGFEALKWTGITLLLDSSVSMRGAGGGFSSSLVLPGLRLASVLSVLYWVIGSQPSESNIDQGPDQRILVFVPVVHFGVVASLVAGRLSNLLLAAVRYGISVLWTVLYVLLLSSSPRTRLLGAILAGFGALGLMIARLSRPNVNGSSRSGGE